MENFLQEMGYNCPDSSWRAQVKMFCQLMVIGTIALVPMALLFALAGWVERMCQ